MLLTADHGMSPVDPARTVYVNELWPGSPSAWRQAPTASRSHRPAPAAISFSTSAKGMSTRCAPSSASALDGVADVVPVDELVAEGIFAEPSRRLRERLANVVVLPRYGEAVYWHEPGRFVQQLHGQHGGLSPQEMEIPLLAWVA